MQIENGAIFTCDTLSPKMSQFVSRDKFIYNLSPFNCLQCLRMSQNVSKCLRRQIVISLRFLSPEVQYRQKYVYVTSQKTEIRHLAVCPSQEQCPTVLRLIL